MYSEQCVFSGALLGSVCAVEHYRAVCVQWSITEQCVFSEQCVVSAALLTSVCSVSSVSSVEHF